MCRLKRFFTFSTVVWLLAIGAVFYLIAIPPLQDAWAYFFWERVPCKAIEGGGFRKFVFDYGVKGTQYDEEKKIKTEMVVIRSFYSGRENFWIRNSGTHRTFNTSDTEKNFDQTCYIAPGKPSSAVLDLTAHKQWGWDRGGGSLFLSGFVICVAAVLTFVSRIRRKASSSAARAP